MYKFFIFCLLFIGNSALLPAQIVADFENFAIGEGTFLNGSDLSGGFESGDVYLPNIFASSDYGDFWSGWAISSVTDNTTPGFGNQYSAIPGMGTEGSTNYAIGYAFDGEIMQLKQRSMVAGMYITNNTFAYFSILDGDNYAKRFGGETGDDPDFFVLTIKAYVDGALSTDSVDFYLADYRADDKADDYLVNTWEWVDLSSLGAADSLLFTLNSSDIGGFGMNTPAYFCVDNVTTSPLTSVKELQIADLSIYPNPSTNFLTITKANHQVLQLRLRDVYGRVHHQELFAEQQKTIGLQQLPNGIYFVELSDGIKVKTHTILKQ